MKNFLVISFSPWLSPSEIFLDHFQAFLDSFSDRAYFTHNHWTFHQACQSTQIQSPNFFPSQAAHWMTLVSLHILSWRCHWTYSSFMIYLLSWIQKAFIFLHWFPFLFQFVTPRKAWEYHHGTLDRIASSNPLRYWN